MLQTNAPTKRKNFPDRGVDPAKAEKNAPTKRKNLSNRGVDPARAEKNGPTRFQFFPFRGAECRFVPARQPHRLRIIPFRGTEIELFQSGGPMTQQKPRVPPRLSPHFYSDFIAHRASRYAACGGRLPTSVKKRYRQSPSYRPMLSDWHDPIQQTGSRTNGRAGIRRVQFLPRPKYS